jgi:hypothetical protein
MRATCPVRLILNTFDQPNSIPLSLDLLTSNLRIFAATNHVNGNIFFPIYERYFRYI